MLWEKQTAGLTTSRLEQLCRAEQIEQTMRLLCALNHWAKARDRLFFADRQALYEVKTALLVQAHAAGHVEAYAYIDGSEGFGEDLAFDMAAGIAAEVVAWRLEELATHPANEQRDSDEQLVCQFYQRMTGKTEILAADVEALDTQQVEAYIRARLEELEREARSTRQPIPARKLMELCIAPNDLLYIQDGRFYHLGSWESWDQLDGSDLRKLDPEGLSLIAFRYHSPNAHYVFHQPFRLAQAFLPPWCLAQLQCAPWKSREHGEYYGRAISESESLQMPIAEILRELGVDIMATCPRQLSDKQAYLLTQAMRYSTWRDQWARDDDDSDDWLDDKFWRSIEASMKKQALANNQRDPEQCPLCATTISAFPAYARLAHWQEEHPEHDLSISQARWALSQPLSKEQFCTEYPPDYRAPDERGQGTRYWRAATLGARAQRNEM